MSAELTPEQERVLNALRQFQAMVKDPGPAEATWENTPVEGPIALTGEATLTGEGKFE